ncbi:Lrp/AsnC family transcriptional regulator [Candidatus Woesearchaeota archaeon]|nr:Lrp/AsnC family transcriptional regulator [Candidatus Woesearchaeota archaeon]MBT5272036.1 Lrp/AsnC family transcriptional regulator [Candidatus Woesearchaeota archaeon]MBT6040777.1 Lrp/AsnC family transcriptional regulator [Candidatus Woesearchaeota archaeon]MBT6336839.1 Lrp/AsnC family transcriptional regulator [Candidatus Woesearchaeota archaeon]MBT7927626.1 Lrp/AsnC family transcriptional regulator [Candidatus Woesearchaeota archaeon]
MTKSGTVKKAPKLDDKDLKILDLLKENSAYTTRQIAKKTLLPVTTIHNRVQRLKREGVIKRYTIELDATMVGKTVVAYILVSADLKYLKEKHKTQYDLAKEMKKIYCVDKVDIVTGGTDLVVFLRVSSIQELDDNLLGKIQLVDGVANTRTLVVLNEG